MKLSSFRYIIPQAFSSLRVNGWMTFAAIVTITISLFMCSMFWLIITNIDANATEVESQVEIVAYIKTDVQDVDYDKIKENISTLEGVKSVDFVSKEDGLENMSARFGSDSDLVAALDGSNPLPDSYSIQAQTPDQVASIAAALEGMEQIDSVRYGQGSVEKLFSLTDTLRKAGVAILLLLAIGAVVLISMAIRLTVYARRKEVMVMKWVGATNAFIRWPFLIEGMLLGLFGGVIASVVAIIAYTSASDYLATSVSFLSVIPAAQVMGQVFALTVIGGVVIGAFGSLIAVTRFLDV